MRSSSTSTTSSVSSSCTTSSRSASRRSRRRDEVTLRRGGAGGGVTAFMWAAFGLLACFVPIVLVVLLGREIDGVVALELGGTIATLLLLCLAQAFGRTSYFGLPI